MPWKAWTTLDNVSPPPSPPGVESIQSSILMERVVFQLVLVVDICSHCQYLLLDNSYIVKLPHLSPRTENRYQPVLKPGPRGRSISSMVSGTMTGIPRAARSVAILVRFFRSYSPLSLKSTFSSSHCGWRRTARRPLDPAAQRFEGPVPRGSCGTCCGKHGSWSPL